MSAQEDNREAHHTRRIILTATAVAGAFLLVLLIVALGAALSAPPAPEEVAEQYLGDQYDDIAETVVETALSGQSLRSEVMAEIAEALAKQVVPYHCRRELQPLDDPTYDSDDWRCLMSFRTNQPMQIAIQAPVDVSMDWDGKDWLGRKRARALYAEIVLSRMETKVAGISLTPDLHSVTSGTTRDSIPVPSKRNISTPETNEYAACLDDTYLRVSRRYPKAYWLPAAAWRCREMQPSPRQTGTEGRCYLNSISSSEQQYPEWEGELRRWYAVAGCGPKATSDSSYIGRISDLEPTRYGACLDNVYLALRQTESDEEIAIATTAWICQEFLPDPPENFRPRCEISTLADTQELFPEWPERLHNWHAIMECLPRWVDTRIREDPAYTTCLEDIYLQVRNRHPKDHAIPAAVWQCREHMPKPPQTHNPRCDLTHTRRAEEEDRNMWPLELHHWNAIAQCYPKYSR